MFTFAVVRVDKRLPVTAITVQKETQILIETKGGVVFSVGTVIPTKKNCLVNYFLFSCMDRGKNDE